MTAFDPAVNGRFPTRLKKPALTMLAPATIYYTILFAIPLFCLFVLSFWRAKGFSVIPDLSLENYAKIATSPLHRLLLVRTIVIGLGTAAMTPGTCRTRSIA